MAIVMTTSTIWSVATMEAIAAWLNQTLTIVTYATVCFKHNVEYQVFNQFTCF